MTIQYRLGLIPDVPNQRQQERAARHTLELPYVGVPVETAELLVDSPSHAYGRARPWQRPRMVCSIHGATVQALGRPRPAARSAQSHPLVESLCEALLATTSLKDCVTPELVEAVAGFVNGQLNALSAAPRCMLRVGLTGFATWVRLSTRQGFQDLPLDARARIVARWAYGSSLLTRQLFRALRTTTLLAAYEYSQSIDGGSPRGGGSHALG